MECEKEVMGADAPGLGWEYEHLTYLSEVVIRKGILSKPRQFVATSKIKPRMASCCH